MFQSQVFLFWSYLEINNWEAGLNYPPSSTQIRVNMKIQEVKEPQWKI